MSDLAVQNRESEQEVMPSFDFLLERETERNTLLAEHRAWLKEIKRERPLPKTHYRVAVDIFEGYAVYGLRDNIAPAASEQSDEAASDTGSKSVLGGQGHES